MNILSLRCVLKLYKITYIYHKMHTLYIGYIIYTMADTYGV